MCVCLHGSRSKVTSITSTISSVYFTKKELKNYFLYGAMSLIWHLTFNFFLPYNIVEVVKVRLFSLLPLLQVFA